MKPKLDLTGQRFGKLLVASFVGKRGTQFYWSCVCDCGGSAEVKTANLRSGNSTSCGCQRRQAQADLVERNTTHGQSRTRTYARWKSMMQRCSDPNHEAYPRYGGRGITIFPAWRDSFEAFLVDMGECPVGKTLDRMDGNTGYHPGNCRWASVTEQNRNRSMCRILTYGGESHPVSVWAERLGMRAQTILSRLDSGWSTERALRQAVR